MKKWPSELDVLAAVKSATPPYSGYIGDQLQKSHAKRIAAGGTGFPPRSSLVLRRLERLKGLGLIQKVSRVPNGYYGYEWRIINALGPSNARTLS